MTKPALIQKTLSALEKLPQERVVEVADFTDYLLEKYERYILQGGLKNWRVKEGASIFLMMNLISIR